LYKKEQNKRAQAVVELKGLEKSQGRDANGMSRVFCDGT
jgi:hypothetical protein